MTEQNDENDDVIRGYASVLQYAKKHGLKSDDLLVMHRDNDPFFMGLPRQVKRATWFAEVFKQRTQATGDNKGNPRGVHYYAASRVLTDWNGEAYQNIQLMSKYLTDASKEARYLGLIDYEAIIDAKNPPPRVYRNYGRLRYNIDTDTDNKEIQFPNLEYSDGTYCQIDIDEWVKSEAEKYKDLITATVYSDDLQPFHLELFIEKADHDRILSPICEKYLTNYQAFKGEGSLTAVSQLMKRIEHVNKPVRIFYISDFDPKGDNMPRAFARKVEYLVVSRVMKKDIKLKHIALLPSQIEKYNLPRIPIKEGDKCKKGFEDKYGVGGVELDALEGVCPGEFKKIVENELKTYFDDNIVQAAYYKIGEINNKIYTRALNALTEKTLRDKIENLNDLVYQHDDIIEPYQNSIDELEEERERKREECRAPYLAKINALEVEMYAECEKVEAPYNTRIDEIEEEKADATESIEADIDEQYQDILDALPDIDLSDINEDMLLPESGVSPTEGEEWIYDSSLSYFDQLKRYHIADAIKSDEGDDASEEGA